MESKLYTKILAYLKENRHHSTWKKIVIGLACVVVFVTTYAMILPAITMSKDTVCGLEEHTHSEECYIQEQPETSQKFVCGAQQMEEAGTTHKHTAECWDENGNLICGLAEIILHTHNELCSTEADGMLCRLKERELHVHEDSCYSTEDVLACGQEESSHTHTEECYTREQGELLCGQEESEDHTHSDECYEWSDVLSCGLEAGEGHVHSPECYRQDKNLVCKKEEIIAHSHDGNCLDENGQLVCDIPDTLEHTHSAECISETEASEVPSCGLEEHQHTEECYAEEKEEYPCGKEEHTHEDACYDADGNLVCELEEHTHTEKCKAPGMNLMADIPGEYVDGGTIQDTNITWVLTKDDNGIQTLTISGEGALPDFQTSGVDMPWKGRGPYHVVIEDGITAIGKNNFYKELVDSVTIGSGVTIIKDNAFLNAKGIFNLVIPGNVKSIGYGAFSTDAGKGPLTSITLGEGVETIGSGVFNAKGLQTPIYIPASVTSIGARAFTGAGSDYTVAADSASFCAADGILYTKDMSELVDVPKKKSMDEYRVPDTVKIIRSSALSYTEQIKKLFVPKTVETVVDKLAYGAMYEEIDIEDGSPICSKEKNSPNHATGFGMSQWFSGCKELRKLHLPANAPVCFNQSFDTKTTQIQLTEITFPNGTTFIGQSQYEAATFPELERVIYNAENAEIGKDGFLGYGSGYELVIGKAVDTLPENFTFLSGRASEIRFEEASEGSWINIAEGAMASAPSPFTGLSGKFYVDGNGVLYSADEASGEAKLIYCPSGVKELTVPGTISDQTGNAFSITAIGKNAMKYADLEHIRFEDISVLKELEPYSLSCPTLQSVNGEKSYSKVLKMLETAGVKIGYRALENTKLTEAPATGFTPDSMSGKKELVILQEGVASLNVSVAKGDKQPADWVPKAGGDESIGGYQQLTGEEITITISHGNVAEGRDPRYRVYFQRTDETCTFPYKPGDSFEADRQKVICSATEDPNTIYLEFTPVTGHTISIPVTMTYPSPSSAGGGLTVWGVIQSKEHAESSAGKIVRPVIEKDMIQVWWKTEPVEFAVTKTSQNNVELVMDELGKAQMKADTSWQIQLTHLDTPSKGLDLAKKVDYTDTIVFPEGLSWDADVVKAVQNGTIRRSGNTLYAGDKKVLSVNKGGGKLVWNEAKKTIDLCWTAHNSSLATDTPIEMADSSYQVTLHKEAVAVDIDVLSDDSEITNDVEADVFFHYSGNQKPNSSVTKSIEKTKGKITLTKEASSIANFGETIEYTLTLSNTGTTGYESAGTGPHLLSDSLDAHLYIRPEKMKEMFDDPEYGGMLTVTITNASLAEWEEVTDAYGGTSWRHPGNSDMGVGGYILTVSKVGKLYRVVVNAGGTYTADTVAGALQAAGYGVTREAQYTCEWKLAGEGEKLTLTGGEIQTFMLYATAKDTFGQLPVDGDWPVQYFTNNPILVDNSTKIEGVATSRPVSSSFKREASIDKQVSRNGEGLGTEPSVANGDVLDYKLSFDHYGSGSYTDLPMVDDLYGNQYLMVLKELNPQLADKGLLETGGGYYVLDKADTYTNVVVGVDDDGKSMTAAVVTVTTGSGSAGVEGVDRPYTGAHTQIKWYFSKLPEGKYRKEVSYKALVDMEEGNPIYTIGNIVWMNDKPGSRIYDTIWGRGGSEIDFDKKIVKTRGELPSEDELVPADQFHEAGEHSTVKPGEKVIYRLTLRNTGAGSFTLNGQDLVDALPDTYSTFKWVLGENVRFVASENWGQGQGHVELHDMEQWYIVNTYGGDTEEADGLQYIRWPKESSITFHGISAVALYFELTFPNNEEGGSPIWDLYEEANGGNMVDNIMYVYDFPSIVHHDLESKGQPMLQKGVYRFSSSDNPSYGNVSAHFETGTNRQYYENRDANYRNVTYYVALYNDGNSRMYLSDLQDLLPKGFTYGQMVVDGSGPKLDSDKRLITTIGGLDPGKVPLVRFEHRSREEHTVYRSAGIVARTETTPEGQQRIIFTFEDGKKGEYALKYDKDKKQYYLDKDEAIVFGYIVDTGLAEETEDAAENVIAMPYTDYQNIGLTDLSGTTVTAPVTERYPDANDGSRLIKTNEQVQDQYGFTHDGERQWLVSEVTVKRGEIVPGITKFTESYQLSDDTGPTKYTNSAPPTAAVNWRVHMTNTGVASITDYTMTDTMPYPYSFTGTVSFEIYDGDKRLVKKADVLSFAGERTGFEDSVRVDNLYDPLCKVDTLEMDGTWENLASNPNQLQDLYVSIKRDDDGNEVLKLWFEGIKLSIPEGGYADVVFSSRNPIKKYENKVYTNFATLTPNQQEFASVGQGTGLKDDAGKLEAVRNSSSVAVSLGYSTESSKHVAELDKDGKLTNNAAHSTDPENNYILLASQESKFRYTLTVENNANTDMQRLIIIDNLPEVDDHSPFHTQAMRNSAFKVCLTDNPGFEVKITYYEDGEKKYHTFVEGEYTVQYSRTTDFGGSQSDDWHGHDTGGDYQTTADWVAPKDWEGSLAEVRSIRVMVRGDLLNPQNPRAIPANSKTEVSFNARIEGEAEPGTIAWNNFGYHYHLVGSTDHLEAMPLVVGIKVPVVPTLEKKLVDAKDEEVTAEEDTKFSFLVYQGDKKESQLDSDEAVDAFKDQLTKNGIPFKQYDLTVRAGQSSSGKVPLNPSDDPKWTWIDNEKYTIVELPAKDGAYEFENFNNAVGETYTFTYSKDKNVTITCENQSLKWSAKIIKVDGAKEATDSTRLLAGAVFGLYSPKESDKITEANIPEEYKNLGISMTYPVGTETWYLKDIKTSDNSGVLEWNDLIRSNYYLLEVKAPAGYQITDPPGMLIDRNQAQQGIYTTEIENYVGTKLPQTGGIGTLPYTAAGLLIVIAALSGLLYSYIKRRKEGRIT